MDGKLRLEHAFHKPFATAIHRGLNSESCDSKGSATSLSSAANSNAISMPRAELSPPAIALSPIVVVEIRLRPEQEIQGERERIVHAAGLPQLPRGFQGRLGRDIFSALSRCLPTSSFL